MSSTYWRREERKRKQIAIQSSWAQKKMNFKGRLTV